MRKSPVLLLLGFLCLSWFSCTKESSEIIPEEDVIADHLTAYIVFPENGPGDNGYLDKVMNAVTKYSLAHPGEVYVLMPEDSFMMDFTYIFLNLALTMEESEDSSLAVFIGSEFKEILYNAPSPSEKLKVLLLEDDGIGAPEWLHTCEINRYGASYLAGAMVAQQGASIIAAMPGDPTLETSIEGFKKGYGSIKGRQVDDVYYLSDSYDGFTKQVKARYLTDSLANIDMMDYHTFFPLAGAANMGIYNAIPDYGLKQAIGMDKDCSSLSSCIPFSIDIAIDSLLLDYLAMWDTERALPQRNSVGLDSKYVNIIFNDDWNTLGSFFDWEDENQIFEEEDMYKELDVEFWKKRYELFVNEAIKEEKAYEKR